MSDLSLKQFLVGINANPADGIRHFAPDVPCFTVRDFVDSSLGNVVPFWSPTSPLAIAVNTAGFVYDPRQDIIHSVRYPWQREFGFAYGYDFGTTLIGFIVDCEPIFFDYAGKHWMIELWKGQYGLETGCEIGIYNRPIGSTSPAYALLDATVGVRPGDPEPSHNLFYDCANDNELMVLSFTLYKNGQMLFFRGPEKHWWLTAFRWGVYSRPEELTMELSITCLDNLMCAALVDALQGMGYSVRVASTTVSFRFAAPSSRQPRWDVPQEVIQASEAADQGMVNAYNEFGFPNNDPNTIITAAALDSIMGSVGSYSRDFLTRTVVMLAKEARLDPSTLINGLVQVFKIGIDEAIDLVRKAGFTL